MGRNVRGASCPWGEISWDELSIGRVVHRASCPWSEMSLGRVAHGASCLWGKVTVGRNVMVRISMERVVHGASFDGASPGQLQI
jgi:hypothetical protein